MNPLIYAAMTRLVFKAISIGRTMAADVSLGTIMDKLGAGVFFAGCIVAIWGIIQLGLSLTQGGGGQQTGTSIMFIVGGVVIAIAGYWLKGQDTSWAGSYISPQTMMDNFTAIRSFMQG